MAEKKLPGKSALDHTPGRQRAIVERITPRIDGGRYPIKRVLGEQVEVEADCFADGHDSISVLLRYRAGSSGEWVEKLMEPIENDRWGASFQVEQLGNYYYAVEAWVDHFKTWRKDFQKRVAAKQDVAIDLLSGALLFEGAAKRASGKDAATLKDWAKRLRDEKISAAQRSEDALNAEMGALAGRYPDRAFPTLSPELRVVADPVIARTAAWYEFFPRSCPGKKGAHGTFADCERHLAEIAEMGFDIVYFPPIHPIGRSYRKGKNNNPKAQPGEPGSPWGIGAAEGGHKSIHPELGTLEDFKRLVRKAAEYNLKIALDIAYQCAPDHPYVKEHPEWFNKRPDGTIQYAENPPKKYQDIYPIDFETEDWKALWIELKSVVDYWIEQGVEVFRVDNPHTKALPFWEWMIEDVKKRHPQVVFLSEAFTRPKLMYNLAKLGFTQSYNYFPWRNTKQELTEFLTELTRTEVKEFFRPNLWPNTPDILTQYLQYGGRPAFITRLILAGTLGASYGIYGPAFELCENTPREAGSEEYLNSEKYEIREWDPNRPGSLRPLIGKLNSIRRENQALHANESIEFHPTTNDQIIAYTKTTAALDNIVLTVVNLDPHHTQSGWVDLPLETLEIHRDDSYQVHDLITGAKYLWAGPRNYVELNPAVMPAHVFRLRRRVRTERDFDYFQ